MTPPLDIDALRRLAEWASGRLREDMNTTIWDTVQAVPALCDRVEEAEREVESLREQVATLRTLRDQSLTAAEESVAEIARLTAENATLRRRSRGPVFR